MKHIALFLLLFATASFAADPAPSRRLAFERGTSVWVADLDGAHQKKIAGGQAPDISSDGTQLAFNTVQAIGQPAHRKIAIAELATGKVKVFVDIPSDNCLQPLWSPDGRQLLFYYYVNNEMRIGIVNTDGTGFRNVQASQPKNTNYWAITWAADGKSLFGTDMESLFQLDLKGNVLKKWLIEKIVPNGGMSGSIRLHASPDGKLLLMDVEMAETERKGWDGPPPSIWTFDLKTEKTTRLTPKTLYAWDAHWLDAPDSILFSRQNEGQDEPSIYRMNVDGKDLKLLMKKARIPSASR